VPQTQQAAAKPVAQPVRRGLWDEEEDETPSRDVRVVAVISDSELLQRMDGLTDLVRSRLEALGLGASQPMDPAEALEEVRALAAEVEDKERQLREQQQMIDELRQTKQNSRLRAELDIAQTELQSLRALLRGGRDFRRENDDLRAELRHLKDVEISEIEREIRDLRSQLDSQREVARQAAAANMRELFFQFMGAAIQNLNKRISGQAQIPTSEITGIVYDVFSQCSDEVLKKIDERGLL
jgi:DNA repair exonuclease SbcCD ATPase subunit